MFIESILCAEHFLCTALFIPLDTVVGSVNYIFSWHKRWWKHREESEVHKAVWDTVKLQSHTVDSKDDPPVTLWWKASHHPP